MYVVVRNPLYRVIAAVVTLAVAAIIYFAFVKPSENSAIKQANQAAQQIDKAVSSAVKSSGQTQQQVSQAVSKAESTAQKVISSASAAGQVPAGVTNLTSCLAAAGGNPSKVQACTAKFQP